MHTFRRFVILWVAMVALLSSPAWAQSAPKPEGQFVDTTMVSDIHFKHSASHTSKKYLPETMGSGVALLDYDNDGRLDIFLVNGAPLNDPTPQSAIPKKSELSYWNRLYHRRKTEPLKT